jgi:hypothetical protein
LHRHTRRHVLPALCAALACCLAAAAAIAADCTCDHATCTDPGRCQTCVPACKATWDEVKTKKPCYSMKCEWACTRGYDCWCAAPAECRCSPPCGRVIVKKRIYKEEGEETVEKVPKYEVAMVPDAPCDCPRCTAGCCWWNPLALLHGIFSR